jgi:hypothetical protein
VTVLIEDLITLKNKDKSIEILRCSEILPNKSQCYRGADYLYSNSVVEEEKAPRQVCRYHAKELIQKEHIRVEEEKNVNNSSSTAPSTDKE